MIDPAIAIIIGAVGLAATNIISAWRSTVSTNGKVDKVQEKVDGNFSDLKAEVVTANMRIAVLTERLLSAPDSTTKKQPKTQPKEQR